MARPWSTPSTSIVFFCQGENKCTQQDKDQHQHQQRQRQRQRQHNARMDIDIKIFKENKGNSFDLSILWFLFDLHRIINREILTFQFSVTPCLPLHLTSSNCYSYMTTPVQPVPCSRPTHKDSLHSHWLIALVRNESANPTPSIVQQTMDRHELGVDLFPFVGVSSYFVSIMTSSQRRIVPTACVVLIVH